MTLIGFLSKSHVVRIETLKLHKIYVLVFTKLTVQNSIILSGISEVILVN